VFPTVNRPAGGQVIGISTGAIGTLFEEIWNGAMRGENGFFPVFLPWNVDPRRTLEWYEATRRTMPNTYRREYPATPEEAFTAGQGAFFPEWDYSVHVIPEPGWYPPRGWRIVAAYDPGYGSRACFKWYAISPEGWAVCYREYYPTQTTDEDQARAIIRMSRDPDGNPERISYIVAGLDCWVKNKQTGESTFEVFSRIGRQEGFPLHLIQAQTDLANGWRRLHSWLQPFDHPKEGRMALLRFTPACANTIRTYPAIRQSDTDPEDVAPEYRRPDTVANFVYSSVLAFNTETFPGDNHPKNWVDFWDAEKFPGPRMLTDMAAGSPSLEFALLAAGVKKEDLYPIDIDRAFKMLTELRPNIRKFWDSGAVSAQLLSDKEVVMGCIWNGRLQTIIEKGAPLNYVWDGNMIQVQALGIFKDSPNRAAAQRLVDFMTQPDVQAKYVAALRYGPTNLKAFDHISADLLEMMPGGPKSRELGFVQNTEWWEDNRDKVNRVWSRWILG